MSHCKQKGPNKEGRKPKVEIEMLRVFMYDSDERQGLGKECKTILLLKRVNGKNSRKKLKNEIAKDIVI